MSFCLSLSFIWSLVGTHTAAEMKRDKDQRARKSRSHVFQAQRIKEVNEPKKCQMMETGEHPVLVQEVKQLLGAARRALMEALRPRPCSSGVRPSSALKVHFEINPEFKKQAVVGGRPTSENMNLTPSELFLNK